MTEAQYKAELAKLREENEKLLKAAKSKLKISVSKQGGVMVLGLRRFPVTYYKQEWLTLLGMADEIKAFIHANANRLSEGKDCSEEAIG